MSWICKRCGKDIPDNAPCHTCQEPMSAGATGYMPWNRPELVGWSIVGLNHYRVNGARYLFCAMTKDNYCITAEGPYENGVFDELAEEANGI